jgi:hypothetical protein
MPDLHTPSSSRESFHDPRRTPAPATADAPAEAAREPERSELVADQLLAELGDGAPAAWAITQAVTRASHARAAVVRASPVRLAQRDELPAVHESSPELVRLLEQLRATVTSYVERRRGAGAPVERVLPEVKALVRAAEPCIEWPYERGVFTARVVRWAIEAYYDQPELRHVPRFY